MSEILAAIFGGLVVAIPAYHIGITRQRAEVFADFLRNFHQSVRKATDLLHDGNLKEEPSLQGVKLYDVYLPSLIGAQVAALYMSEKNRKVFLCKMKEYYDLHSSPDIGSNRFDRLEKIINDMQNIFASELSPILRIKNKASSLLSRAPPQEKCVLFEKLAGKFNWEWTDSQMWRKRSFGILVIIISTAAEASGYVYQPSACEYTVRFPGRPELSKGIDSGVTVDRAILPFGELALEARCANIVGLNVNESDHTIISSIAVGLREKGWSNVSVFQKGGPFGRKFVSYGTKGMGQGGFTIRCEAYYGVRSIMELCSYSPSDALLSKDVDTFFLSVESPR